MQYRATYRLGRHAYSTWGNLRAMLAGFKGEIDTEIPAREADRDRHTDTFIRWSDELETVGTELSEMEDMFAGWDNALAALARINQIVNSNQSGAARLDAIKDALEGVEC